MNTRPKKKSLDRSNSDTKKGRAADRAEKKSFFTFGETPSSNRLEFFKPDVFRNPSLYFWTALVLFILPVSLVKIYDTDIWWHMRLGQSMLENMGLPDYEKFYFSPVVSNYNELRFTFLGDIFFYCVHWMGGVTGLQMVRLCVVILLCWLVKSISGSRPSGWLLFVLMLLVVGTYQQQLVRNSIFSVVLTAFFFWLWCKVRYENREKLLWAIPVVLGVWGCLHGSYLMGFGLAILVFAGDWLDSLRGLNPGKKKFAVRYAVVVALSFALIAAWNPLTKTYFSVWGIKHLLSECAGTRSVETGAAPVEPTVPISRPTCAARADGIADENPDFGPLSAGVGLQEVVDLLERGKNALNNTIFKQNHSLLKSADFVSPFDKLDRLYVKLDLILGAVALVLLTFFCRPVRFSNLFPFAAVLFFGMGYLRMVGYIPIVAGAALGMAWRNSELKIAIDDKWAKGLSVMALIALYANLASGYKIPIGSELHAFGFGVVPTYSGEAADKILQDHKDKNALTTIVTGSFLLFRWHPHKRVFLDGFFAPHSQDVFNDYHNLLSGKVEPDFFHGKYGIEIAVVEQNKASLNSIFLTSPNWHVRYVDKGMIVYFYEPDDSSNIPSPALLGDPDGFSNLPDVYRARFAKYLLLIQDSLIKSGRLKDAMEFRRVYADLIERMNDLNEPGEINYVNTILDYYLKAYGEINSRVVACEIIHFEAAEKKDSGAMEKFGLEVLKHYPDRFPVTFNLASVYASHRNVEKSGAYLKELWRARFKDRVFWNENSYNIAKLCLNLFYMEKKDGRRLSAYEFLSKARQADNSSISREKLYDEGIKLVGEDTERGAAAVAYEILKRMERDFPDDGRLLNEIAGHILKNGDRLFVGPEKAEEYAAKAVRIMEKNKNPLVDTAYDTLAEACFRLKKYDGMVEYEKSAIETAPASRKGLYKHRLEQEAIEK